MLLKVYGANVLMLLLLRSLCRYKHTVNAHRQMHVCKNVLHICMLGVYNVCTRTLSVYSVQGYVSGTYTSDSCFRAASSLGTDVSILPSK